MNDAREVAEWYNKLQDFAEGAGLGIPITISSDPQHGWTEDTAVGNVAASFSRWTEPMGFAALRDPQLLRQFADIAREEYVSVGIRQALHPQIDLVTEPRVCTTEHRHTDTSEYSLLICHSFLVGTCWRCVQRGRKSDRLNAGRIHQRLPG